MIQIAKAWTIMWLSESKLANRKPFVHIHKEHAHQVNVELTGKVLA